MLRWQEAIELALEMTEGRVKKFSSEIWLASVISNLIHKKKWWWRKKTFTFTSVAGTQQYDLAASGIANADDFEEMINLSRVVSGVDPAQVKYRSSPTEVQSILHSTTSGTPAAYIVVPGTPKVIRFDYNPVAAETYRGLYWAGYNFKHDVTTEMIPLIPDNYHFVVVEFFLLRLFQYLFGQKDPRYVSQVEQAKEAYAQLCAFDGPGLERIELRSADADNYVRATS